MEQELVNFMRREYRDVHIRSLNDRGTWVIMDTNQVAYFPPGLEITPQLCQRIYDSHIKPKLENYNMICFSITNNFINIHYMG